MTCSKFKQRRRLRKTTTPESNDLIGFMRKNNHVARPTPTLVHFFAVSVKLELEISKLTFGGS